MKFLHLLLGKICGFMFPVAGAVLWTVRSEECSLLRFYWCSLTSQHLHGKAWKAKHWEAAGRSDAMGTRAFITGAFMDWTPSSAQSHFLLLPGDFKIKLKHPNKKPNSNTAQFPPALFVHFIPSLPQASEACWEIQQDRKRGLSHSQLPFSRLNLSNWWKKLWIDQHPPRGSKDQHLWLPPSGFQSLLWLVSVVAVSLWLGQLNQSKSIKFCAPYNVTDQGMHSWFGGK